MKLDGRMMVPSNFTDLLLLDVECWCWVLWRCSEKIRDGPNLTWLWWVRWCEGETSSAPPSLTIILFSSQILTQELTHEHPQLSGWGQLIKDDGVNDWSSHLFLKAGSFKLCLSVWVWGAPPIFTIWVSVSRKILTCFLSGQACWFCHPWVSAN